MSNQLENKQRTLAQMLAANRLIKIAADQEIERKQPTDQTNLGAEQAEEAVAVVGGISAASPEAANTPAAAVETPPNCQDLEQEPEQALSQTGTEVNMMDQSGTPATFPKTAAYFRGQLAGILSALRKQASMQEKAQKNEPDKEFKTGTEVMQKIASLSSRSTQQELDAIREDMIKLANTNPFFGPCRDRILMQKLAADVDSLAEAEGISPEEAAAALDEAAAVDSSIMANAEDDASGEAVAELAEAEAEADELYQGAEALAANASEVLGTEVAPEDILDAIDEVESQAAELGVPPEALIEAALEDMQDSAAGGEITPEDEANAAAILEEAAEQGVSPEEVIELAAMDLEGSSTAEAATEGKKEEEGQEKQASLTPRAAYAREVLLKRAALARRMNGKRNQTRK